MGKKNTEILRKDCETEKDFTLLTLAKELCKKANDLIEAENICIDGNKVLTGQFVADTTGIMGVGFLHDKSAAYTHIFGLQVRKDNPKKEKILILQMNCEEKDIKKYFEALRFVHKQHFVSL